MFKPQDVASEYLIEYSNKQVDLCIAVKAVKSVVSVYHTNDEDDEDSDEDEDEDEYETEQKIQVLDPNEDHIGDVADKLEKANHRVYIRKDVALEDKPDDDAKDNTKFIRFTRCMVDGYKEFRTALREKKDHKFDDKNYPKDRRFGLFVDRRECKNKHKLNEMIFFEQMDKGGTIPKGFVSEWYINCQRECILPGIGDKKDKSIGAVDNVCGQLITFSFNVEAANEIKCYIIWNGQCMRWAGDNLEMILSYIFYNKCKELKQIKEALKTFNKQLKDIKFDEFYEKINNGYQPTDTVKPYGS